MKLFFALTALLLSGGSAYKGRRMRQSINDQDRHIIFHSRVMVDNECPQVCDVDFTTNSFPDPTRAPTKSPTAGPTRSPTYGPTGSPTYGPTGSPTYGPTRSPIAGPTPSPTYGPTSSPTSGPTAGPTASPTAGPTSGPTRGPTAVPTASPTGAPTSGPTSGPTDSPTFEPTAGPTSSPTAIPTKGPTAGPTVSPTSEPTKTPTVNIVPDLPADTETICIDNDPVPNHECCWHPPNKEMLTIKEYGANGSYVTFDVHNQWGASTVTWTQIHYKDYNDNNNEDCDRVNYTHNGDFLGTYTATCESGLATVMVFGYDSWFNQDYNGDCNNNMVKDEMPNSCYKSFNNNEKAIWQKWSIACPSYPINVRVSPHC